LAASSQDAKSGNAFASTCSSWQAANAKAEAPIKMAGMMRDRFKARAGVMMFILCSLGLCPEVI
jgi:hypothetical protein